MFWVLETILPYLKINKEVTKDNVSFRILTELNFGIFVACSIFVGSTSLIGEPILCQYKGDSEPEAEFINTFCWIHGTRDLGDHVVSDECKPDDGISSNGDKNDEEEKNKNLYYQWVVFMLLFSAVLFKIPTWIWSFLENGLMKLFNSENHLKNDMWNQDEKEIEAKAEMQANSFRKIKGRNMTMVYYAKFMLCQMLAWVMLFVNFYLTDLFLDGSFKTYGSDVLNYFLTSAKDPKNPMCLVFPTKVGCKIKTGGSGGKGNVDVEYCILSQNIINEKIYLVLWFWFYALIGLLAFQVVLELIILASPFVRQLLIIPSVDKELFLTPANQRFLSTCTIGDWFVLYQISKNNHQEYFFTFLGKLSEGYNEVVTNDTPTENYCNSMEKTQEEV